MKDFSCDIFSKTFQISYLFFSTIVLIFLLSCGFLHSETFTTYEIFVVYLADFKKPIAFLMNSTDNFYTSTQQFPIIKNINTVYIAGYCSHIFILYH